jgi:hypothetical protein
MISHKYKYSLIPHHHILVYLITGGHTIGQSRCLAFRDRIYNDTNIDFSFAKMRRDHCPRKTGGC